MVNDCYDAPDQKIFHEGMDKLNDFPKKTYGDHSLKENAWHNHDLLVKLDARAKEYMKKKRMDLLDYSSHGGRTLLGYFTSKIGCTQARRYM